MNDFAQTCHRTYYSQRMNAIAIAIRRINQAADESLEILANTNISPSIADPLVDHINNTANLFEEEFSKLRRDFKLKKQVNQYWILLQPILCDNDLSRYLDFMKMSYRHEVAMLIKLVNQVDLHIGQFEHFTNQMISLHQINELKYKKINKIAFYVSTFVVIALAIWMKI